MAEWRVFRGWTDAELRERLAATVALRRNFEDDDHQLTTERGWGRHFSEAVVGKEAPGAPARDGAFERAWRAVSDYLFSDPRIVKGHFDASLPLLGRRMLLEVRVWGLHYLNPVVVSDVREEELEGRSVRRFRYDTIEGHFERGSEWFVITKEHASGEVLFRIHAAWKHGQLPNWWSRIGFRLLARRYQRAWHRLAHLRLRALLDSQALPPLPRAALLVHSGPEFPVVAPAVQTVATGAPPAEIDVERESPERTFREAT
jgi:uncharacterized protein (UPF0548 family)